MSGSIAQQRAPVVVDDGSTATTISDTITGVTAGNTIVAHVGWSNSYGPGETCSVSDGTAYSVADSKRTDTTNNQNSQIFYLENAGSGSHTVTATFTASTAYRRIRLFEVAGLLTSGVLDAATGQFQLAPGLGANGVSSGASASTTNANCFVMGFSEDTGEADPGSGTISAGTGYTIIGSSVLMAAEYKSVSSTGAQTATFTRGTTDSARVTHVVAFKEAATGTAEQEGFRWGVDDGNESSHTWEAAQDTDITLANNQTRLLRVLIDSTDDLGSTAYTLRYQKNGSGGYVAVPVGATPTFTLDLAVTAGADDAQQSGTTMTVTGTTIGASLDATTEYVGIRFQGVTIPPGATITSAYMSVVPSGTGEDEPLVTITGFDEDNTAQFTTTASDITNRAVTTASASWSSTNLGATGSSYHNTPDLTSIVQEIVDRGGWASGNAMGFRIQGGSTSTRDLTIEAYENGGANPPLLHVEYTAPAEVYIATSANITAGGEATTARLTAPSGKTSSDFTTGRRWDDENGSDSIDIVADQYTELEWAIALSSAPANDDYFDFRVYAGSSPLDTYTVTPKWTVSNEKTASGTPTAQAATVAGTATVGTENNASGAVSAQSATTSGTAERIHTGSGTPSAQAASASGAAEREVPALGTGDNLYAQSATVAGTATLGDEVTGSGAVTGQAASVAGTAERVLTSSGAVSAQASSVSGTAERAIVGSGASSAQAATTSGTAERALAGSGAVSAQAATASGTAERTITSSGSVAAQSATVAGAAQTGSEIVASGAISAQGSSVAGTAERSLTGGGTVSAQAATASGVAERVLTSSGTPAGQSASVTGSGQVGNAVGASGAVSAQAASASGTAERSVTGSGAASGQSASTSGAADVAGPITATGAVSAQSATVISIAERILTANGAMQAQAAAVAGYQGTPAVVAHLVTGVSGRAQKLTGISGRAGKVKGITGEL